MLGPRTEVFGKSTFVLRGILPFVYFHCHPKGDSILTGYRFPAHVGITANFLGTCENAQSFVRYDTFAGTPGLPTEHRRTGLEEKMFLPCGTQNNTPPNSCRSAPVPRHAKFCGFGLLTALEPDQCSWTTRNCGLCSRSSQASA